MRLFHLVTGAEWDAHRASGAAAWAPASLAREGFVHLSRGEQVAGSLDVHFSACPRAWLLEVDPSGMGDALVHEASRGGALFPHLYRPLAHGELLRAWELLAGNGGLCAPLLGSAPEGDLPAGGPPPL